MKLSKTKQFFIVLSAFLDDEKLIGIFVSDMLDNPEFSEMFRGLVFADFTKPFECVGTRAEIRLALYRAYQRRKNGKLPLLLKEYITENPEEPENLDDFFDEDNFVPEEFIGLLRKDSENAE